MSLKGFPTRIVNTITLSEIYSMKLLVSLILSRDPPQLTGWKKRKGNREYEIVHSISLVSWDRMGVQSLNKFLGHKVDKATVSVLWRDGSRSLADFVEIVQKIKDHSVWFPPLASRAVRLNSYLSHILSHPLSI